MRIKIHKHLDGILSPSPLDTPPLHHRWHSVDLGLQRLRSTCTKVIRPPTAQDFFCFHGNEEPIFTKCDHSHFLVSAWKTLVLQKKSLWNFLLFLRCAIEWDNTGVVNGFLMKRYVNEHERSVLSPFWLKFPPRVFSPSLPGGVCLASRMFSLRIQTCSRKLHPVYFFEIDIDLGDYGSGSRCEKNWLPGGGQSTSRKRTNSLQASPPSPHYKTTIAPAVSSLPSHGLVWKHNSTQCSSGDSPLRKNILLII